MPGSRLSTPDLRWLATCGCILITVALVPPDLASADETKVFEDSSEATEGVLVMRNGTVMAGMISQSEDLYTVGGKYGNVQVPAGLVKMRCASLQAAYARLHDLTVAHHSANSHLTLAKWCVTNELDQEAIQELNAARELEPEREDVQRMLRNVTEGLKSGRKKSAAEKADKEEPARTARTSAPVADDAAGVGGLAVPQALHYIRRIQPLLVKSCATAGCHTLESNSGFQLHHVVPGKSSTRHASELNLAEILQRVDFKNPSGSRLLTTPQGKHGRNGRPVFSGPRGQEQLAELEAWIQDVARDENRRHKTAAASRQQTNVQQSSATGNVSGVNRAAERDPFAGTPRSPAVSLPGDRRERKLSDSDGADPFDPASFNRQASGARSNR